MKDKWMDKETTNPSINRRTALHALGTSAVGVLVSSQFAEASTSPEGVIEIQRVSSPKGDKEAIIRNKDGDISLVIKTGNAEHVAYAGDRIPMHPTWNDKGNRLALSLSGSIHTYNPGGKLMKQTDYGLDSFPLFENGRIIFHRQDRQLRISDGTSEPEEIQFDLTRLLNHPALSETAAAAVKKYAQSGGK
ncbi:hypothetical protein [Salinirubrum litoreum]|uniref:Uncharacterized protein n=1 Tax=Salinirubrum litoreum TaxID=1126234 RepID=A0ABD5RF79_9EURY|nr:hypothetical protein [Salinirubrum litoreum]